MICGLATMASRSASAEWYSRAEVLQVKAREVNHAADAVAQAVFADNKIDRIQAQPPLTITPSAEKDKLNPEKLRQVC